MDDGAGDASLGAWGDKYVYFGRFLKIGFGLLVVLLLYLFLSVIFYDSIVLFGFVVCVFFLFRR